MNLPLGLFFIVGFEGTTLPQQAHDLIHNDSASIILFKRNIESTEQLVALNQEIAAANTENPSIVSVDHEGGRVSRLKEVCTPIPSMRDVGLASEQDDQLPYRLGAMMARELNSLGFHLNYAPVVDIDSNPQNPVIGNRSFGSDAQSVSQAADKFIKGLQGAGVGGCAKHFPGHGDTDTDSHLALPTLDLPADTWRERELAPFKAAIESGVASIMTAHILCKGLDPDVPATLSKPILTGILREELGYEGLIISDDLDMKGLADHFTLEEIIEQGVNAGVDMFIIGNDIDKSERAIAIMGELLESGKITQEQLNQSAKRIQTFKEKYHGAFAPPDLTYAQQTIKCGPHIKLVEGVTSP